MYLRKVQEGGGAVSARIVIAAVRGILLKYNPSMLAELGDPVDRSQPILGPFTIEMNEVCTKEGHNFRRQVCNDTFNPAEGRLFG